MYRRSQVSRLACLTLAAALAAVTLACGGGGGGGTVAPPPPMGLTAAFAPANANPGANTLNMTATTNGANFAIQINVTDITDFFGAGFRVTYNPASAQFANFSTTGSTLVTNTPAGATTDFDVTPGAAGELLVGASLQGQVQGITVAGTELLITLNFTATAATAGNPFGFDTAATRVVTTCPAPPTACSNIADATLTWSGGTMTATN